LVQSFRSKPRLKASRRSTSSLCNLSNCAVYLLSPCLLDGRVK
jgi:hypothetical protein